MAKKNMKQKSTQTVASAEQDIIGLVTTLVQKLTALEAKIDNVLSRVSQRPAEAPRHQPAPVTPSAQNNNRRPMHSAVCADCGKNCEVPFRPSADRPVYCQNCFSMRKKNSAFAPRPAQAPKPAAAVKAQPPAATKKKPAKKAAKKTKK